MYINIIANLIIMINYFSKNSIKLLIDFMSYVFVESHKYVKHGFKNKTALEFTVSSGQLFHLLIFLAQKELILNIFWAQGIFSVFK